MTCYEKIGKQIKTYRKARDLKQIDIAVILDCKQSYISQLEKGQKKIRLDQLLKIADEFNLPLDYFLEREIK